MSGKPIGAAEQVERRGRKALIPLSPPGTLDANGTPTGTLARWFEVWLQSRQATKRIASQRTVAGYRDDMARGVPDADGETWVALLHRPGPAAPEGAALFEDPRFEEHLAFLIRMRDAGYLVAAGSLSDAPGEGMTILRLPGAGQLDRATELATKEDSSVAGGFFRVTVRPWRVALQSPALGR